MDGGKSPTGDRNDVRLQISETGSGNTMFEPRANITMRESSNVDFASPMKPAVRAPEKKLTLFALRLAVLEKAATGLGTLGFIWATVVLLGGFAITLDKTDFWFITIILLIEGTRIFSRSHELEWQHQATWSIADAGLNSFRALRASSHFSAMEHIRCSSFAICSMGFPVKKHQQTSILASAYICNSLCGALTNEIDQAQLWQYSKGRHGQEEQARCSQHLLWLGIGRSFVVFNRKGLLGMEGYLQEGIGKGE